MENVAHTFAGLLVAELAFLVIARRTGRPPEKSFRRVAYGVSAFANNVPDFDQLYLGITPGKIGYLLHHRGHTHTLAVGVLLGLAVGAIGWLIARRRQRESLWFLLLLGALGPVTHLSMDGWNTYGVHPFWPLDSRWFYGDFMFIVEPLLWLFAIPPLFRAAEARWWKVVLALLFGIMVLLPWLLAALVPLGIRIAVLFCAVLALGLSRLPGHRQRLASWAVAWALVVCTFAIARGVAERRLRADLSQAAPALELYDIALSPLPANPACWTAVIIAISPADEDVIVARRGFVALAGDRFCPTSAETTTAPLEPVSGGPSTRWAGELRQSLSELRELARRCDVSAAMRFYRMPFWLSRGGSLILGDLRFDRDEGLDFAELELSGSPPAECPRFVPDWQPPRADLLGR